MHFDEILSNYFFINDGTPCSKASRNFPDVKTRNEIFFHNWTSEIISFIHFGIIIKNATFDTSKKILGPVHLHPKTDKWDYLRSPIMKKIFVSCFDIGEVPRSPGKWNWNWLYFLPFIFTFEQGAIGCYIRG